jgi:hypothetical protein
MNYYFEEHAREELRDAIAYYEAIDLELGNSFRAAIQKRYFLDPAVYQRLATTLSHYAPVSH